MFKLISSTILSRDIFPRKVVQCSIEHLKVHPRLVSTSKMNLEKAAEELQRNPYFNKYADKIAALQKSSPEAFLAKLKENEERKNSKESSTKSSKSAPLAGQPGKPKAGPVTFTKPKVLSDVMKLDLLKDKSSDDIKAIWLEYHKYKDCISASLPPSKFELIKDRGEKFPVFLLPLPRDQGYEFIVCQFSGNEVHFTPLISYQAYKDNSPECLTIAYYPDLKDTKGIVLMRGEFNKDWLTAMEAQCLANELQMYYGEEHEKRTRLLERFTYSPDEFKHMDLVANLETLSF